MVNRSVLYVPLLSGSRLSSGIANFCLLSSQSHTVPQILPLMFFAASLPSVVIRVLHSRVCLHTQRLQQMPGRRLTCVRISKTYSYRVWMLSANSFCFHKNSAHNTSCSCTKGRTKTLKCWKKCQTPPHHPHHLGVEGCLWFYIGSTKSGDSAPWQVMPHTTITSSGLSAKKHNRLFQTLPGLEMWWYSGSFVMSEGQGEGRMEEGPERL